jgi:hypothetical protein
MLYIFQAQIPHITRLTNIYVMHPRRAGIGVPGGARYIACPMALFGLAPFHIVAFKKAFGCGTRGSSGMYFTGTRFV